MIRAIERSGNGLAIFQAGRRDSLFDCSPFSPRKKHPGLSGHAFSQRNRRNSLSPSAIPRHFLSPRKRTDSLPTPSRSFEVSFENTESSEDNNESHHLKEKHPFEHYENLYVAGKDLDEINSDLAFFPFLKFRDKDVEKCYLEQHYKNVAIRSILLCIICIITVFVGTITIIFRDQKPMVKGSVIVRCVVLGIICVFILAYSVYMLKLKRFNYGIFLECAVGIFVLAFANSFVLKSWFWVFPINRTLVFHDGLYVYCVLVVMSGISFRIVLFLSIFALFNFSTVVFFFDFQFPRSIIDLLVPWLFILQSNVVMILLEKQKRLSFWNTYAMRDRSEKLEKCESLIETLLTKFCPNCFVPEIKNSFQNGVSFCRHFDSVFMSFSDIVGFTKFSCTINSEELIGLLNKIYSQFDSICEQFSFSRGKTYGDAYSSFLIVTGVNENECKNALKLSLALSQRFDQICEEEDVELSLRTGLSVGDLTFVSVGTNQLCFDFFGKSFDHSQVLEQTCPPGCVNVDQLIYEHTQSDYEYRTCVNHGNEIKGYVLEDLGSIVDPGDVDLLVFSANSSLVSCGCTGLKVKKEISVVPRKCVASVCQLLRVRRCGPQYRKFLFANSTVPLMLTQIIVCVLFPLLYHHRLERVRADLTGRVLFASMISICSILIVVFSTLLVLSLLFICVKKFRNSKNVKFKFYFLVFIVSQISILTNFSFTVAYTYFSDSTFDCSDEVKVVFLKLFFFGMFASVLNNINVSVYPVVVKIALIFALCVTVILVEEASVWRTLPESYKFEWNIGWGFYLVTSVYSVLLSFVSENNLRKAFDEKNELRERTKKMHNAIVNGNTIIRSLLPDHIIQKITRDDALRLNVPSECHAGVVVFVNAKLEDEREVNTKSMVNKLAVLNELFSAFDQVIERSSDTQKIKSMGWKYMYVAKCELSFFESTQKLFAILAGNDKLESTCSLVIGASKGKYSAGMIGELSGKNTCRFDIIGECVNRSARLMQKGDPNRVHVSREIFEELSLCGIPLNNLKEKNVKMKGFENETTFTFN